MAPTIECGEVEAPILFAVLEYPEFQELLRLACRLRDSVKHPPLFVFLKRKYRTLSADTAKLAHHNIPWMTLDGAIEYAPAPRQPSSSPPQSGDATLTRQVATSELGRTKKLLSDLGSYWINRRRYRNLLSRLGHLLDRTRPKAVVVGQEYVGSELSLLVRSAQERWIPSVIIPYAMFNLEEFAGYAARCAELNAHVGFGNRLVARYHSKWVHGDQDGNALLRLEAGRALALEHMGLAGRTPWVPCSGPIDKLLVDSQRTYDAFEHLGIERSRIEITGSMVQDQLASTSAKRVDVRTGLFAEHRLNRSKPLILCAWPPNSTTWAKAPPMGFRNYAGLAEFWAQCLAELRRAALAEVIVKPHPKTLATEYAAAQKYGLAVSNRDTAELLVAADALVTTASSVTAWAIMLARPVIDFDCYGFNYKDFVGVPGVVSVSNAADFKSVLTRLASDSRWRQQLSDEMAAVSEDWGRLDGLATQRIARELQRLISSPSQRAVSA